MNDNAYTSYSVENDDENAINAVKDLLIPSQFLVDSSTSLNFDEHSSQCYVQMEIDMYHQHNQLFGGFRSACWRSRYRKNLLCVENMVDVDDAKFMLYVTSLNRQNTGSMNDTLYKFLSALELRHGTSFMQPGVTVPTCNTDANRYILKGEFAIMDLLPKPKMHIIA